MKRWAIGSGHLFLSHGDLTQYEGDAIVNAANTHLAGGGGVDGAIHLAANSVGLHQECQAYIATHGPLHRGHAMMTSGFGLKAHSIIHTVGPIWRGGSSTEASILRQAYLNSLTLAHHHKMTTIAFPAISCGVYGYPHKNAAHIALETLKHGLEQGLVIETGIILHGKNSYDIWLKIAQSILP